MDVSHFGLFDLSNHQPPRPFPPAIVADDRVVPIEPLRRGVANDNIKHTSGRTRAPQPAPRGRAYKAMFRLVLHRGTEPGQA